MTKKTMLKCLCAGSVIALSSPGLTQEEQGITPLEEIVVTTERREQRLQDVPLSITAFGDVKRDTVGILSIQDMSDFAPGFTYDTSTDQPSIRGVARQSNTFSLDSPVANYIDGVYTSSVQDAQRGPIFVERTEILRGPQGALSGRGSVAGAINTHLKRPSNRFEAEFRSYAENYDAYGAAGTVTGPLTDWLRGRLNVTATRQDEGYFENVANGETEGDQPNNRQTADFMIAADLGADVDLYVKTSFTSYEESRRSGGSYAPYTADVMGLPPNPYGYLGSPLTPTAYYGYFDPNGEQVGDVTENPVRVTGDERKYNNNYASRQWLDDHHNYTAHLTWHTDLFDVKWIGGHQNYQYTQRTDGDDTAVTAMTLPTGRVVNPSAVNTYMEDRQWFSNELTLTSNSDGPFQWVAGLYQSKEDYFQTPLVTSHEGYDELAAPIAYTSDFFFVQPPSEWDPRGAIPNTHGNTSVYGQLDGETVSSAVFGQLEYQFTDAWKFTLGMRYNKDEKNVEEQTRYIANNVGQGNLLAGGASGFAVPVSLDATPAPDDPADRPAGVLTDYIDPTTGRRVRDLEGEWDATAGTVGLDYTPNDDTLLYFRIASGYRPGGFDAGYLSDSPQVDEESLISYELGYKGSIADQLQLSTSAFYYDYEDQQLELPALGRCTDPDDLNTCTITDDFFNVPQSESTGVEVELTWFATEDLNFLLSYGYLNSTIEDGLINGEGVQNPNDPAAILPNANRYREITGQTDDYTGLTRWFQDISGNKAKDAPEHKVALNATYTFALDAGDLTLSTKYAWRDESYSDVFETEPGIVDGFSTVGVRAIWTDIADRYTVIVYGDNIFDEVARDGGDVTRLATADSGAAGQQFYREFNLIPPRTYGIELQYRFGR